MGRRTLLLMALMLAVAPLASAQPCSTAADADCDGMINITELTGYIDVWYGCSACAPDLFSVMDAYYHPCADDPGCPAAGTFCAGNAAFGCSYQDGCLEKSNMTDCGAGGLCSRGACIPCASAACADYGNETECLRDACGLSGCAWNWTSCARAPSCGDGYCSGNETNETCAMDCQFVFAESRYDPVNRVARMYLRYAGMNDSAYSGKYVMLHLSVPGTGIYKKAQSTYSTYLMNYGISVTEQEVAAILAAYPDGRAPFNFTYLMTNGSVASNESSYRAIFMAKGFLRFRLLSDNDTYEIGVFQVIPLGANISGLNICFVREDLGLGEGYVPRGAYPDCAAKWDWGTFEPQITTWSVPLEQVMFSRDPYTTFYNVTSLVNRNENKSASIRTYSLRHLGDYWEWLLRNNSINNTRLKMNPSFNLTFLPYFEKNNTLNSSTHSQVIGFFKEALKESNVSLDDFDFRMFVLYIPDYTGPTFLRSFVSGLDSYVSLTLYESDVVFNKNFKSIAHEMGHQLWTAPDLYEGFGIKYPTGVPDPLHFPQEKACIMAQGFGWANISETLAVKYETEDYDDEEAALGIDRFHTEDPANFVLCNVTISMIEVS